jgi:putative salt-induced outer membrane protein YdiY
MSYPKHIAGVALAVAAVSVSTAVAQDAPDTGWKTSAGLNFALTSGNSDTLLVGANFNATKKWEQNELIGTADVAYGEATTRQVVGGVLVDNDSITVNNFGAALQYNRLISERFYLGARVDGRRDEIADIDYRFTGTANAGYYFIKEKNITLSGEAGPGYVVEKLGLDKNDYLTVRFGEKFTWNINERARVFQDLEFMPEASDFGNYIIQGQIGLEADIIKNLALRVTLQDTYRARPAAIGGTVPLVFREKNDLRLLAGINYKF